MKNPNNYEQAIRTWTLTSSHMKGKEQFFVSYAVRGPMVVPSYGLRQDMPVNHPIPGPVHEPSPLNNRWIYSPPGSSGGSPKDYLSGIL